MLRMKSYTLNTIHEMPYFCLSLMAHLTPMLIVEEVRAVVEFLEREKRNVSSYSCPTNHTEKAVKVSLTFASQMFFPFSKGLICMFRFLGKRRTMDDKCLLSSKTCLWASTCVYQIKLHNECDFAEHLDWSWVN